MLARGTAAENIKTKFQLQSIPESLPIIRSTKTARSRMFECAVTCLNVEGCYGYVFQQSRCNLLGCGNTSRSDVATTMAYYQYPLKPDESSRLLARGMVLNICILLKVLGVPK